MAGRAFPGEITSIEALTGDSSLITITCPAGIAAQAKAGQFIQVSCRDAASFDPFLRQSFFLFSASPRDDTVTIAVRPDNRGRQWLVNRRAGDGVELTASAGNGFTVNPMTRNLLLVATGRNISALAMLATESVERGLNVTLLMGAETEADLLSPIFLPSSVEVVAATRDGSRGQTGDIVDLLPTFARWADQVFSQGSRGAYRQLATALQPHRIANKPTLQIAVDREQPCGFGVCNGCPVATKRGTVMNCVRGPVFDADELV